MTAWYSTIIDGQRYDVTPVETWFDRHYVMIGQISLTTKAQLVDVIDITDHYVPLARRWDGEPDCADPIDSSRNQLANALVLANPSDEGRYELIRMADGRNAQFLPQVLPVVLAPARREDASRALLAEIAL